MDAGYQMVNNRRRTAHVRSRQDLGRGSGSGALQGNEGVCKT